MYSNVVMYTSVDLVITRCTSLNQISYFEFEFEMCAEKVLLAFSIGNSYWNGCIVTMYYIEIQCRQLLKPFVCEQHF